MKVQCPDCGLRYDDVDHMTWCPHPWFPEQTFTRSTSWPIEPTENP